jgi:hypothetical protein
VRRLLRILLNGATILSLLLCVATAVLWVRSYVTSDVLWWHDGSEPAWGEVGDHTTSDVSIELDRGGIAFKSRRMYYNGNGLIDTAKRSGWDREKQAMSRYPRYMPRSSGSPTPLLDLLGFVIVLSPKHHGYPWLHPEHTTCMIVPIHLLVNPTVGMGVSPSTIREACET